METGERFGGTDLFLLRVWRGEARNSDGEVEWHGKVQRVTDGASHRFSSWEGLVDLLVAMLSDEERR